MPGAALSAALALRLMECAAHKGSIGHARARGSAPAILACQAARASRHARGKAFRDARTTTYGMRCVQEKRRLSPRHGGQSPQPTVLPRRRASHRARFDAASARAPDALARCTGSSIVYAKHGTRSPFPRLKSSISCPFFTIRNTGGEAAGAAPGAGGRPPKHRGSRAMPCPHTHQRPTRCADEGACMAGQPWPLLE